MPIFAIVKTDKKINENGRVFGKGVPKAGKRRKGGGPKFKYGEPTDTIAFRVPVSKKKEIEDIVDDMMKKFCI